jgi:hypothetical protein
MLAYHRRAEQEFARRRELVERAISAGLRTST